MEEFRCSLCGRPLSPTSESTMCSFCGKTERSDYICSERHYVCEKCRLASPEQLVKKACEASSETDPMRVVILLMKHPAMPMHGPEHHYLVGCAMLTALKNLGKFEIDSSTFDTAIGMGKQILYGSCSRWGVCGAAAAVGTTVSIVTHADMMSDKERSLAMESVSETLKKIAGIGGPRCCKASTFAAIQAAVGFFTRNFGVEFPDLESPIPCYFAGINDRDCLRERCPYFK